MTNTIYSLMNNGSEVLTETPYDESFIAGVKRLGGKYRGDGVWAVQSRHETRIIALAEGLWGAQDEEMVLAEVTATERHAKLKCVSIRGIGLARNSRRSDVSVCEGIAIVNGDLNYYSNDGVIVESGTVFEAEVPASYIDAEIDGWNVKRLDSTADPAERIAEIQDEKKRLVAKLTELDAELATLEAT